MTVIDVFTRSLLREKFGENLDFLATDGRNAFQSSYAFTEYCRNAGLDVACQRVFESVNH